MWTPPPSFLVLCMYTINHASLSLSFSFFMKINPHFPKGKLGFTLAKEETLFYNLLGFLIFFLSSFSFPPPTHPDQNWLRVAMKNLNLCCYGWVTLCSLIRLAANVSSKNHGNQANDLVEIINRNRTSQKLPQLTNSPGLGCMALQYVQQCKGNGCTNNTLNCHLSEDDFTQIFAPNCGIELPTFGTISALVTGCQHKYLDPFEAFSTILARDNKSLSLVRNRSHTEVGVGLIGTHKHKGPYFWCVMFSDSRRNTTFVLEDLGKGIKQKSGCCSGTGNPCSKGRRNYGMFFNWIWIVVFTACILLRTVISL